MPTDSWASMNMASSQLQFFEFKAGRYRQLVEARIIRFWKAHKVNKGGGLMGVDILLVNGKVILLTSLLYTFTYRFCTSQYVRSPSVTS